MPKPAHRQLSEADAGPLEQVKLLYGPCTVTNGCMRSPNFPDVYPDNVYCEFQALVAGTLQANTFEVEMAEGCAYDYFQIQGSCEDTDSRATDATGDLCSDYFAQWCGVYT